MKKQIISSDNAPKAMGPYSPGVMLENLLFLSGSIPLDPKTQEVVAGGIAEQTTRVLENMKALLESNSSSLDKVVKTTVFLKDMNDFSAMNAVYGQYFTKDFPARSTVQVVRLPKDVLIEIEVIAYK